LGFARKKSKIKTGNIFVLKRRIKTVDEKNNQLNFFVVINNPALLVQLSAQQ
jgi:hypothetical protein